VLECTSPSGAPGTFTVTATDLCDAHPTIACDHASGSTFPFGTTTVCCTATDHSNNSSQCCFTITVRDTTPPAVTCPANQTVQCTSASGATVTFSATATDLCDLHPVVTCTPASGSLFPSGSTQVCCTAHDDNNNVSTQCCFTVTVTDGTPPTVTCPANI